MYRRRKPLRDRERFAATRNVPKFSFTEIRSEVRAISDVVLSFSRDEKVEKVEKSSAPVLTLI